MAFLYRDSNNKVISKQAFVGNIIAKYISLDDDLRFGRTFEFLPNENPRVTIMASMDRRYSPVGITKSGTVDKRFASVEA